MRTQLYRSRTDRMIAGVAGGLGRYLGIDSTFVRLFFVLLAFGPGIGVWIYLILWIILPEEGQERDWQPGFGEQPPAGETSETGPGRPGARNFGEEFAERARGMGEDMRQAIRNPNPQAGIIIGGALIVLGVIYLLQNLNLPWLSWFEFDILWPLLLVLAGIVLLFRHWRGG